MYNFYVFTFYCWISIQLTADYWCLPNYLFRCDVLICSGNEKDVRHFSLYHIEITFLGFINHHYNFFRRPHLPSSPWYAQQIWQKSCSQNKAISFPSCTNDMILKQYLRRFERKREERFLNIISNNCLMFVTGKHVTL